MMDSWLQIAVPLGSSIAGIIGFGPVVFRHLMRQHRAELDRLIDELEKRDKRILRLESQVSDLQGQMLTIMRDELVKNACAMDRLRKAVDESSKRHAVCPNQHLFHQQTPRPER